MDRIDWHSGFVNAMKLELLADEESLEFEDEHLIANRAQRIDLLIIKKVRSIRLVNEIGEMFDKYNVQFYGAEPTYVANKTETELENAEYTTDMSM